MFSITSEPDLPHDDLAELTAWLKACRLRLTSPSQIPRCELLLNGAVIGSLHPDLHVNSTLFWPPAADASEALLHWALHLRAAKR